MTDSVTRRRFLRAAAAATGAGAGLLEQHSDGPFFIAGNPQYAGTIEKLQGLLRQNR